MGTRTNRTARDIEAEVTSQVIDALERGDVPWRKPWTAAGILPTNVDSGKAYRGINAMLLALSQQSRGYASPYWLTFEQAKARGGSVRKGEKATLVVFWKNWEVRDKDSSDPDATKRVFILRHYNVFNLDQTDDVKLPERCTAERAPVDVDETAEAIWAEYADGPALRNAAVDAAFYSPSDDEITLPRREQFDDSESYYGTLFHEMVHSTGHESRLSRFEKNGTPQHFGSERYAKEELVAEMGAAMLRSIAGIESDDSTAQSAAYVRSWLGALREDKSLVVKAAGQAQRAVDRIAGTTFEEKEAAA